MHDLPDGAPARRHRRRFDDELDAEPHPRERHRLRPDHQQCLDADDVPDGADRWTTWLGALHGPQPRPDWVVTELGAVDFELGVLKSGKEADVHVLRREVPGTQRGALVAAKRYRSSMHRMFHRDAGYLEGRRVRRSREMRAMTNRTAFGRDLLAGQWAAAEFAALSRLWQVGCAGTAIHVPYPVQLDGSELLMEFIGMDDGTAAPRLAQLHPEDDELADLWSQLVTAMSVLARAGLAHGDLSAFNLLVHRGRLVLIDLPQVVDVVGNPNGPAFLARDVRNVAAWFCSRGLPAHLADPDRLTRELVADAGRG